MRFQSAQAFDESGHPGAIGTHPPGYLLEVQPDEVDTEEFANLVATARRQADGARLEEAAATLGTALALWRGPALSNVDSELVRRGAARLEDDRIGAIEERMRLTLALGRHAEILGELSELVAEHPLRERLAGLEMLALYRSGRQADALEVGRRTRATLVEELGIEPGQELRRLEVGILNADPALDPPSVPAARTARSVVPRQLPASTADFTGRETLITEITRTVARPGGFALPIVAISGAGGVGKTSLAVRVAHELSGAFPDGQLYGDLQSGDDPVLARFLHALGERKPPDDPAERAELYRSLVAGKRLLVVLDDVATEEQALPLLPGSPSCAVITTSRMRLTGLSGAS